VLQSDVDGLYSSAAGIESRKRWYLGRDIRIREGEIQNCAGRVWRHELSKVRTSGKDDYLSSVRSNVMNSRSAYFDVELRQSLRS
jgi:hypothetical protein